MICSVCGYVIIGGVVMRCWGCGYEMLGVA